MNTDIAIHIIACTAVTAIFAACCALLSYLLDFCFNRGNIFQWYLPWLAKTIMKRSRYIDDQMLVKQYEDTWRADADQYTCANYVKSEKAEDEMLAAATNHPLYKMLGGCIVCFNIWCAMISFVVVHYVAALPWWCMLPYVLFASFVLRKIVKV